MTSVPAVRILPLDRKDFDNQTRKEVQDRYFSRRLRRLNGRFYFYKRGLDVEEGAVVLFQYDNAIIASAVFLDSERYAEADEYGCCGHLDFDPTTIRTFVPIELGPIQKIWPEVKEFGQVRWILNSARYRSFLRLTMNGATIAETIIRAILRVVGTDRKKVFSRDDVRRAANIDRSWWVLSWNPIFQGMRIDHPGKAPKQTEKHRGVIKRVGHGSFVLTRYGQSLLPANTRGRDGRRSAQLQAISESLEENGEFDPKDQSDDRDLKLTRIAQRRGGAFRRKLLRAYKGRCAVTGCNAEAALEAAHILPYLGNKSDFVSNGLLLRSDIHTLFDLDLIGIHPTKMTVVLAAELHGTSYASLAGRKVLTPTGLDKRPDAVALKRRWKEFRDAGIA